MSSAVARWSAALAILSTGWSGVDARAESCDARVSSMVKRLAWVPRAPYEVAYTSSLLLPKEARAPMTSASGVAVEISSAAIRIEGRPVPDVARLRLALAELDVVNRRLHGELGPAPTHAFLPADDRVDAVLPALCAMSAARPVTLMIAGPVPVKPKLDPPKWVQEVLAKAAAADPSEKPSMFAKALDRAVEGRRCPAIERFFAALGAAAQNEQPRVVADLAPKAVAECRCGSVDVDAFEALLVEIIGLPGYGVPLPLRCEGEADDTVKLAANATVQDLAVLAMTHHQRHPSKTFRLVLREESVPTSRSND